MKIKLLSADAKIPTRADEGAAGYDLYAPKSTIIYPGRNILPLDFAIELPHLTEADVRARSGFSAKGMEGVPVDTQGETPVIMENAKPQRYDADVLLGCVDETYRGNVGVIIKSCEKQPFAIVKGTRVAQMVIQKYHVEEFDVVEELNQTERGEGGFGHGGVK